MWAVIGRLFSFDNASIFERAKHNLQAANINVIICLTNGTKTIDYATILNETHRFIYKQMFTASNLKSKIAL